MPPPSPLPVLLDRERSYALHFSPLEDVPSLLNETGLRPGRCLLVTDENVASLYLSSLLVALTGSGWMPYEIVLVPGESTKSTSALQTIYDEALAWGIDRKTPVLALGGGVVGDLAGFAAASLLRGLPLVQIPTTLIAQVDSAIGGKTGINHRSGKNLIGAFHQPRLVCTDVRTLQTLPEREWSSGLAEVVKHALVADAGFFDTLDANWAALLKRSPEVVENVVYHAARIKTQVVAEDEREQGRRAILNFGHTFGHAIERVAGYGTFTHGEAVALGMRAALHLSHHLQPDLSVRRALDLVRRIPGPDHVSAPVSALMEAMLFDKKVEAGQLRLILLRAIGEAYVTARATEEEVRAAWCTILA